MKVKELIEELSKLDPEKKVWFGISEDILGMGAEYSSAYATSVLSVEEGDIFEYGDEFYEDEDLLKDEIANDYDYDGKIDVTNDKDPGFAIIEKHVEEVFSEIEKKKKEIVLIDICV